MENIGYKKVTMIDILFDLKDYSCKKNTRLKVSFYLIPYRLIFNIYDKFDVIK